MEKKQWMPGGHIIDIFFTLALLCVFTASALLVVLTGANVYRSTVSDMNGNFNVRTSITYIATKIHQNDTADGVFVTKLGDTDALVLEQNFDEQVYRTWIYYYDGELREIFSMKDNPVSAADGQTIMSVPEMKIEEAGDQMLRFTYVDDTGNQTSLMIFPRCE